MDSLSFVALLAKNQYHHNAIAAWRNGDRQNGSTFVEDHHAALSAALRAERRSPTQRFELIRIKGLDIGCGRIRLETVGILIEFLTRCRLSHDRNTIPIANGFSRGV